MSLGISFPCLGLTILCYIYCKGYNNTNWLLNELTIFLSVLWTELNFEKKKKYVLAAVTNNSLVDFCLPIFDTSHRRNRSFTIVRLKYCYFGTIKFHRSADDSFFEFRSQQRRTLNANEPMKRSKNPFGIGGRDLRGGSVADIGGEL